MKTLRNILLLLAFVLTFSGCLEDEDEHYALDKFWIAMGTIEEEENSFIVATDGGDRLYPSVNDASWFETFDGQRVWVNYTILGTSRGNQSFDYFVRINHLKEILTKGILELTPENRDSIGNDPLVIKHYWLTNNFLNIEFLFKGGGTIHYINLVKDIEEPETEDGLPILEVKHNANNDPYIYLLKGLVSFDISEMEVEEQPSVEFLLRATGESGEYEFEEVITYEY